MLAFPEYMKPHRSLYLTNPPSLPYQEKTQLMLYHPPEISMKQKQYPFTIPKPVQVSGGLPVTQVTDSTFDRKVPIFPGYDEDFPGSLQKPKYPDLINELDVRHFKDRNKETMDRLQIPKRSAEPAKTGNAQDKQNIHTITGTERGTGKEMSYDRTENGTVRGKKQRHNCTVVHIGETDGFRRTSTIVTELDIHVTMRIKINKTSSGRVEVPQVNVKCSATTES